MNFYNWAMENGYSDDLEIDRIDNNGNYCPENCRWVSRSFNRNHQRKTRYIEAYGIKLNISQWCRELEISKKEAYIHLNNSEDDFCDFIKEKIDTGKGQVYFVNRFLGR